jgi:hypothetical protein
MPELLELSEPVEGAGACFDAHHARRKLGDRFKKTRSLDVTTQSRPASRIESEELEHVLCQVQTDGDIVFLEVSESVSQCRVLHVLANTRRFNRHPPGPAFHSHGGAGSGRDRVLDNDPEFTAKVVREWLPRVGVDTLFITLGSPWGNGCIESANGKLRDELLNREIFYPLGEAKVLIDRWRQEHDAFRPHSSLEYRPPAPEAVWWRPGAGEPITALGLA